MNEDILNKIAEDQKEYDQFLKSQQEKLQGSIPPPSSTGEIGNVGSNAPFIPKVPKEVTYQQSVNNYFNSTSIEDQMKELEDVLAKKKELEQLQEMYKEDKWGVDWKKRYEDEGSGPSSASTIFDSDYAEYDRLRVTDRRDPEYLQEQLAANQSTSEQLGRGLNKLFWNTLYQTVGGIGAMFDFEDHFNQDDEVGNWLTDWANKQQQAVDDANKIYKSNNRSWSSLAWWIDNGVNLASSMLSFAAQGAALGYALSPLKFVQFLSKGKKLAETAAAAEKSGKLLKAAQKFEDGAKTFITSAMLNQAESIMSATDVYSRTYKEAIDRGYSDEYARKVAAASATQTIAVNKANIMLNLTSANMFTRGFKSVADAYKQSLWKQSLKEAIQESAEELINMKAEKAGEEIAKTYMDNSFFSGPDKIQIGDLKITPETARYNAQAEANKTDVRYKAQDLGIFTPMVQSMYNSKTGNFNPFYNIEAGEALETVFWGALGGAGQTAIVKGGLDKLGSSEGFLSKIPGVGALNEKLFGSEIHKVAEEDVYDPYSGTLLFRKGEPMYETQNATYKENQAYQEGDIITEDIKDKDGNVILKVEKDDQGKPIPTSITEEQAANLAKANVYKHKAGDVITREVYDENGVLKEVITAKELKLDEKGQPILVKEVGKDGKPRKYSKSEMEEINYQRQLAKESEMKSQAVAQAKLIASAELKRAVDDVNTQLEELRSRNWENKEDQKDFLLTKLSKNIAAVELATEGNTNITTEMLEAKEKEIRAKLEDPSFDLNELNAIQTKYAALSHYNTTLNAIDNGQEEMLLRIWDDIGKMTKEQAAEKGLPDNYAEVAEQQKAEIKRISNIYYSNRMKKGYAVGRAATMNRLRYEQNEKILSKINDDIDKRHDEAFQRYLKYNKVPKELELEHREKFNEMIQKRRKLDEELENDPELNKIAKEIEDLKKKRNELEEKIKQEAENRKKKEDVALKEKQIQEAKAKLLDDLKKALAAELARPPEEQDKEKINNLKNDIKIAEEAGRPASAARAEKLKELKDKLQQEKAKPEEQQDKDLINDLNESIDILEALEKEEQIEKRTIKTIKERSKKIKEELDEIQEQIKVLEAESEATRSEEDNNKLKELKTKEKALKRTKRILDNLSKIYVEASQENVDINNLAKELAKVNQQIQAKNAEKFNKETSIKNAADRQLKALGLPPHMHKFAQDVDKAFYARKKIIKEQDYLNKVFQRLDTDGMKVEQERQYRQYQNRMRSVAYVQQLNTLRRFQAAGGGIAYYPPITFQQETGRMNEDGTPETKTVKGTLQTPIIMKIVTKDGKLYMQPTNLNTMTMTTQQAAIYEKVVIPGREQEFYATLEALNALKKEFKDYQKSIEESTQDEKERKRVFFSDELVKSYQENIKELQERLNSLKLFRVSTAKEVEGSNFEGIAIVTPSSTRVSQLLVTDGMTFRKKVKSEDGKYTEQDVPVEGNGIKAGTTITYTYTNINNETVTKEYKLRRGKRAGDKEIMVESEESSILIPVSYNVVMSSSPVNSKEKKKLLREQEAIEAMTMRQARILQTQYALNQRLIEIDKEQRDKIEEDQRISESIEALLKIYNDYIINYDFTASDEELQKLDEELKKTYIAIKQAFIKYGDATLKSSFDTYIKELDALTADIKEMNALIRAGASHIRTINGTIKSIEDRQAKIKEEKIKLEELQLEAEIQLEEYEKNLQKNSKLIEQLTKDRANLEARIAEIEQSAKGAKSQKAKATISAFKKQIDAIDEQLNELYTKNVIEGFEASEQVKQYEKAVVELEIEYSKLESEKEKAKITLGELKESIKKNQKKKAEIAKERAEKSKELDALKEIGTTSNYLAVQESFNKNFLAYEKQIENANNTVRELQLSITRAEQILTVVDLDRAYQNFYVKGIEAINARVKKAIENGDTTVDGIDISEIKMINAMTKSMIERLNKKKEEIIKMEGLAATKQKELHRTNKKDPKYPKLKQELSDLRAEIKAARAEAKNIKNLIEENRQEIDKKIKEKITLNKEDFFKEIMKTSGVTQNMINLYNEGKLDELKKAMFPKIVEEFVTEDGDVEVVAESDEEYNERLSTINIHEHENFGKLSVFAMLQQEDIPDTVVTEGISDMKAFVNDLVDKVKNRINQKIDLENKLKEELETKKEEWIKANPAFLFIKEKDLEKFIITEETKEKLGTQIRNAYNLFSQTVDILAKRKKAIQERIEELDREVNGPGGIVEQFARLTALQESLAEDAKLYKEGKAEEEFYKKYTIKNQAELYVSLAKDIEEYNKKLEMLKADLANHEKEIQILEALMSSLDPQEQQVEYDNAKAKVEALNEAINKINSEYENINSDLEKAKLQRFDIALLYSFIPEETRMLHEKREFVNNNRQVLDDLIAQRSELYQKRAALENVYTKVRKGRKTLVVTTKDRIARNKELLNQLIEELKQQVSLANDVSLSVNLKEQVSSTINDLEKQIALNEKASLKLLNEIDKLKLSELTEQNIELIASKKQAFNEINAKLETLKSDLNIYKKMLELPMGDISISNREAIIKKITGQSADEIKLNDSETTVANFIETLKGFIESDERNLELYNQQIQELDEKLKEVGKNLVLTTTRNEVDPISSARTAERIIKSKSAIALYKNKLEKEQAKLEALEKELDAKKKEQEANREALKDANQKPQSTPSEKLLKDKEVKEANDKVTLTKRELAILYGKIKTTKRNIAKYRKDLIKATENYNSFFNVTLQEEAIQAQNLLLIQDIARISGGELYDGFNYSGRNDANELQPGGSRSSTFALEGYHAKSKDTIFATANAFTLWDGTSKVYNEKGIPIVTKDIHQVNFLNALADLADNNFSEFNENHVLQVVNPTSLGSEDPSINYLSKLPFYDEDGTSTMTIGEMNKKEAKNLGLYVVIANKKGEWLYKMEDGSYEYHSIPPDKGMPIFTTFASEKRVDYLDNNAFKKKIEELTGSKTIQGVHIINGVKYDLSTKEKELEFYKDPNHPLKKALRVIIKNELTAFRNRVIHESMVGNKVFTKIEQTRVGGLLRRQKQNLVVDTKDGAKTLRVADVRPVNIHNIKEVTVDKRSDKKGMVIVTDDKGTEIDVYGRKMNSNEIVAAMFLIAHATSHEEGLKKLNNSIIINDVEYPVLNTKNNPNGLLNSLMHWTGKPGEDIPKTAIWVEKGAINFAFGNKTSFITINNLKKLVQFIKDNIQDITNENGEIDLNLLNDRVKNLQDNRGMQQFIAYMQNKRVNVVADKLNKNEPYFKPVIENGNLSVKEYPSYKEYLINEVLVTDVIPVSELQDQGLTTNKGNSYITFKGLSTSPDMKNTVKITVEKYINKEGIPFQNGETVIVNRTLKDGEVEQFQSMLVLKDGRWFIYHNNEYIDVAKDPNLSIEKYTEEDEEDVIANQNSDSPSPKSELKPFGKLKFNERAEAIDKATPIKFQINNQNTIEVDGAKIVFKTSQENIQKFIETGEGLSDKEVVAEVNQKTTHNGKTVNTSYKLIYDSGSKLIIIDPTSVTVDGKDFTKFREENANIVSLDDLNKNLTFSDGSVYNLNDNVIPGVAGFDLYLKQQIKQALENIAKKYNKTYEEILSFAKSINNVEKDNLDNLIKNTKPEDYQLVQDILRILRGDDINVGLKLLLADSKGNSLYGFNPNTLDSTALPSVLRPSILTLGFSEDSKAQYTVPTKNELVARISYALSNNLGYFEATETSIGNATDITKERGSVILDDGALEYQASDSMVFYDPNQNRTKVAIPPSVYVIYATAVSTGDPKIRLSNTMDNLISVLNNARHGIVTKADINEKLREVFKTQDDSKTKNDKEKENAQTKESEVKEVNIVPSKFEFRDLNSVDAQILDNPIDALLNELNNDQESFVAIRKQTSNKTSKDPVTIEDLIELDNLIKNDKITDPLDKANVLAILDKFKSLDLSNMTLSSEFDISENSEDIELLRNLFEAYYRDNEYINDKENKIEEILEAINELRAILSKENNSVATITTTDDNVNVIIDGKVYETKFVLNKDVNLLKASATNPNSETNKKIIETIENWTDEVDPNKLNISVSSDGFITATHPITVTKANKAEQKEGIINSNFELVFIFDSKGNLISIKEESLKLNLAGKNKQLEIKEETDTPTLIKFIEKNKKNYEKLLEKVNKSNLNTNPLNALKDKIQTAKEVKVGSLFKDSIEDFTKTLKPFDKDQALNNLLVTAPPQTKVLIYSKTEGKKTVEQNKTNRKDSKKEETTENQSKLELKDSKDPNFTVKESALKDSHKEVLKLLVGALFANEGKVNLTIVKNITNENIEGTVDLSNPNNPVIRLYKPENVSSSNDLDDNELFVVAHELIHIADYRKNKSFDLDPERYADVILFRNIALTSFLTNTPEGSIDDMREVAYALLGKRKQDGKIANEHDLMLLKELLETVSLQEFLEYVEKNYSNNEFIPNMMNKKFFTKFLLDTKLDSNFTQSDLGKLWAGYPFTQSQLDLIKAENAGSIKYGQGSLFNIIYSALMAVLQRLVGSEHPFNSNRSILQKAVVSYTFATMNVKPVITKSKKEKVDPVIQAEKEFLKQHSNYTNQKVDSIKTMIQNKSNGLSSLPDEEIINFIKHQISTNDKSIITYECI
jgi:hypothetical protein